MSRLGKKPIIIPEKTEVKFAAGVLSVKGPLGELTRKIRPEIRVKIDAGKVELTPHGNSSEVSALWGTYASHIKNMVMGVNQAFVKKLIIEGIGYKAEVKGEGMTLNLGFSHPVNIKIPKGLKVVSEKGSITISGFDKELVGQFAAAVRALKKPEPYKGKGIRYDGEVIRRKQGKKTA